jgi:hypothetical protein
MYVVAWSERDVALLLQIDGGTHWRARQPIIKAACSSKQGQQHNQPE